MDVFFGIVHLKTLTVLCVVEGEFEVAVYSTSAFIHGWKLPLAEDKVLTVGGVANPLSTIFLPILIEQGVTDFTINVSLV
jgi:hypothetical protein